MSPTTFSNFSQPPFHPNFINLSQVIETRNWFHANCQLQETSNSGNYYYDKHNREAWILNKMNTYFFLSILGISLFSAFSTITFSKKQNENIKQNQYSGNLQGLDIAFHNVTGREFKIVQNKKVIDITFWNQYKDVLF